VGLRQTTLGLLALLAAVLALFVLLIGVQIVFDDHDDKGSGSARMVTQRTIDERLDAPVGDIDRLRDGDVRLVEVTGIRAGAVASVRQCSASREDCDPWIPVVADGAGRAVFLFEFRSDVGPREVSCDDERCVLLVRDDTNRTVVTGRLFFGTRASPIEQVALHRTLDSMFGVGQDAQPGTVQLTLGLVAAAILAGAAVAIFRRNDWSSPEGDAFAGVEIDRDPFDDDQPAMSRRMNDDSEATYSTAT
jgi:hypothetical protein